MKTEPVFGYGWILNTAIATNSKDGFSKVTPN